MMTEFYSGGAQPRNAERAGIYKEGIRGSLQSALWKIQNPNNFI